MVKVRQSYAEVTATQRRLLKQKEQASAVADDWYKRAQLALKTGNEELAREALNRRQQNTDEAESLQQQIDFQAASIDKLYEGMQLLEVSFFFMCCAQHVPMTNEIVTPSSPQLTHALVVH